MRNLKHTVVASLAIVMIGSMAATQVNQLTLVRANGINNKAAVTTQSVVEPTSETKAVWHEDIVEDLVQMAEVVKPAMNMSSNVGYVVVTEGALNVRSAANTESEVVDQLLCAQKVAILGEENDWYKVSYGLENKEGYVAKQSITSSYETARDAALKMGMYEVGSAVVGEGALNIREAASTDAAVVDQFDNGDQIIVQAKEGEWLKVYYGREYKTGYVIASSVTLNDVISKEQIESNKNKRVAAAAIGKAVVSIAEGAVNVREEANESSPVKTQLSNKTNVLVLSRDNGWTKIAYGSSNEVGYVKSEYIVDPSISVSRSSQTRTEETAQKVAPATKKASAKKAAPVAEEEDSTPATASTSGQALVNEAKKYLGTKYVYGGSSPSGFDCSGLVQYVCRKQGISVSRSSGQQFGNGVSVSKSNLQPGDLVFFQTNGRISHVGIYAGGGQMIHSPQTGKTVSYSSIETPGRTASYAGARRVAN